MYKKTLLAMLLLFSALVSTVHAEENRFYRADLVLRDVYKHYTGVSLYDAIDNMLKGKDKIGSQLDNDVMVQFNGGDWHNRLYVGKKNTLQFLVINDEVLAGLSLAFEFTCTAGPGSFDWVQGYDTISPLDTTVFNILKIHPEAFEGNSPWISTPGALGYPDTIILGAVAFGAYQRLPVHDSEEVLYSMQIELPDDPSLAGEEFCIDNIFIPPATHWVFTSAAGQDIVPGFQGQTNSSGTNPDANPVCFDIVNDPRCSWDPHKGGNSAVDNFTPGQIKMAKPKIDYSDPALITIRPEGDVFLHATIYFDGDENDLKALGVEIGRSLFKRDFIYVSFPLYILPQVCQVNGVKIIRHMEKYKPQLNYSTGDINCEYAALKDSLGSSGDSVIIGIIDTGIDWLHEDFIDTNGFTRILFVWDQITYGLQPDSFSYGQELDSYAIDSMILAQDGGIDFQGHGTQVAGIAAGNGRSRSDTLYRGVAPEANFIIVKTNFKDDGVEDAIDYIRQKAFELDMPWVVNISFIKTYEVPTSHDGSHNLEKYIDSIVSWNGPEFGKGRVFVVAAGNEAHLNFHSSHYGPGDVELTAVTCPDSVSDFLAIYILYDSSGVIDPWVSIISPDQTEYGPVELNCALNRLSYEGCLADTNLQTTDGVIKICHNYFNWEYINDPVANHPYDNIIEAQIADGTYECTGEVYQMRQGTWKIRMGGTNLGLWDAYIYRHDDDTTNYPKRFVFVADSINKYRTLSSPGCAKKAITVGSVNSSRTSWKNWFGNIDSVPASLPADSISFFSCLGPTRDGRADKPELYAPGAYIMSCRSDNVTDPMFSDEHAYYTNYKYHDSSGYYCIEAGTSLSAPHVAGAAALILDRNPNLSAKEIRDLLADNGDRYSWNPNRIDINVYDAVEATHGIDGELSPGTSTILPDHFALNQNYPNPFNPITRIGFDVPEFSYAKQNAFVQLEVYNILGQRVKTLLADNLSPGEHHVAWDGTSDSGNKVASGIYFYRCTCNGEVKCKKMAFIK
jgi:subtilisin family serine protease